MTVFEAMITMGLVMVASTAATMAVAPVLHASTSRSATEQLVADLRLTRMKAIAQNTRFRIRIDADARRYAIEREQSVGNFVVDEGPFALPESVTLGEADPANPIFDPRGGASAPTSIELSAPHGPTHTVTISILGQVQAS